ncbi:Phosphoglycerate kinase [Orchesella cincta]|uniref:Phosphoglycerate kinase n=1 Tax=Orchesella cincta TaxID=48709 RepID=A0A1D2MY49_ORCCI|nr:Phosphoglycerate kinase [Orchesella cincta]
MEDSADSSEMLTGILIPQVFPIIINNLNVSLNTLLDWRLITHEIQLAIDTMIEEESAFLYNKSTNVKKPAQIPSESPDKTTNGSRLSHKIIQKYVFNTAEEVQNFLSHFGAPSSSSSRFFSGPKKMTINPFLTRSVYLATECEGEQNPKVVNPCRILMLETFGYHIRNMTFHISGTLLGDSLIHFRALLPLVPNIKCLKIVGCAEDWVDSEEFIRVVVRLPELEKLELLDISNFTEEFSNFYDKSKFTLNELLVEKYGSQLTTLICEEALFKRENVGKVLNSLPNLKTFRLSPVTHSNTLLILSEVEWPVLEELELWGDDGSGGNYDPFSDTVFGQDFIRAVNNFSASLVHLKLHGIKLISQEALSWEQQPDNKEDHNQLELSAMPRLVTLTTELSNIHINWLWNTIRQNSKQLEEVTVQTFSVSNGGLNELQREFNMLPKLKRIVIHCKYPDGESQAKKIVLKRTSQ